MSTSPKPTTNDLLASPSTLTPPPKIGVIICSQRQPRIGDQVGHFVFENLKQHQEATTSNSKAYELSLIDLADNPLPLFDEPVIPQTITNPLDYHHEHTRQWSQLITAHAAFIFVTPQYNWGYPASVKNAIDYLFNEWVGKPALIVSYGGHGGGHAAEQLRQVLTAVKMRVVQGSVGLMFPKMGEDGRGFLKRAARGMDLGLGKDGKEQGEGTWMKEMEEVKRLFTELVGMLDQGGKEKRGDD